MGGEFWLGNENIYTLTNQKNYELRVDMQEVNGTKHFIKHNHVRIGHESAGYSLTLISPRGKSKKKKKKKKKL